MSERVSDKTWEERVAAARAEDAPVFQKNGLPIVAMRGHDGALLEHEHADHPDYKYPVEVEFIGSRPDTFNEQCVRKDKRPAHYGGGCQIQWDNEKDVATCVTCKVQLTVAERVHIQSYSFAEIEGSTYEPHEEALIYSDAFIAITLHECCYTMWHRRGGDFLHGPDWNSNWRLSAEACKKIWPNGSSVQEESEEP